MPRVRFHFAKRARAAFVSHIDLPVLFSRAARRAGLTMEITQGFSPHPKVALGPPLPVGVVGLCEPAEMWFGDWSGGSLDEWRRFMPEGIEILQARRVDGPPLSRLCAAASYIVVPVCAGAAERTALVLETELSALGSLLGISEEGGSVFVSVTDLERSGPSKMVRSLSDAGVVSGWPGLSIVRTAVGLWGGTERGVIPLTEEFSSE
jgi:hypothetical protein